MTHNYVDKSVQTTISGLTKHASPNPPALAGLEPTTPPEDMPAKDVQNRNSASNAPPSLLMRRKQQASFVRNFTLPSDFDEEGSHSPPPTEALLSPLPAANKLHAGHTPIMPRSLSPLRRFEEHSRESSPEIDEPLTGPLMLPALPGDGAEERIELKVLDAALENIAKAQSRDSTPSPSTEENEPRRSRAGSAADARRRSSTDAVEVVDGVILKKPRMNMGAPLGQA